MSLKVPEVKVKRNGMLRRVASEINGCITVFGWRNRQVTEGVKSGPFSSCLLQAEVRVCDWKTLFSTLWQCDLSWYSHSYDCMSSPSVSSLWDIGSNNLMGTSKKSQLMMPSCTERQCDRRPGPLEHLEIKMQSFQLGGLRAALHCMEYTKAWERWTWARIQVQIP